MKYSVLLLALLAPLGAVPTVLSGVLVLRAVAGSLDTHGECVDCTPSRGSAWQGCVVLEAPGEAAPAVALPADFERYYGCFGYADGSNCTPSRDAVVAQGDPKL